MELDQKTIEDFKKFSKTKTWENIKAYMEENLPICYSIPETQEQIVKLSHSMSFLAGYKNYENILNNIINEEN